MSKWYMTVGYPGGEFAVRCEAAAHFTTLKPYCEDINAAPGQLLTRKCPPDVAEWLDAIGGDVWIPHDSGRKYKVAGGWIITNYENYSTVFIPVPHTANITVLEVEDA